MPSAVALVDAVFSRAARKPAARIPRPAPLGGRIVAPAIKTLGRHELLSEDFVRQVATVGFLMGDCSATERLLSRLLPTDRAAAIMQEVRVSTGNNIWQRLAHVPPDTIANVLPCEHPQTAAVVLSKLPPDQAARVLAILPDRLALDVIRRLLRMQSILKDVLNRVEDSPGWHHGSKVAPSDRHDVHALLAEIFSNFDRRTAARFLSAVEPAGLASAERIDLISTFDDLVIIDPAAVQTLLGTVAFDQIALALKGASQQVRVFFNSNMPPRAAKLFEQRMQSIGPVLLRDIDEAQEAVVRGANALAARGEISIAKRQPGAATDISNEDRR